MDFTAIDFETATHLPFSACSLGAVRIKNGRVAASFDELIRPPDNKYWKYNTGIHGLAAKDTKKAASFDEVWQRLEAFTKGTTLVAHNASFDGGVVKYAASYHGLVLDDINIVCSKEISKAAFPKAGGASLSVMTKYLKIKLQHHDALSDAKASAKIVLAAAKKRNIKKFDTLYRSLKVKPIRIAGIAYREFPLPSTLEVADDECGYVAADYVCDDFIGDDPLNTGRCAAHR